MLHSINKLPRRFFFWTYYVYIPIVAILFAVTALVLGEDGLTPIELLLLALLVLTAVAIQRFSRPIPSKSLPTQAEVLEHQITHSDRMTLLAFESEYCPICMVTGPQVQRLEQDDHASLRVVRLSIQNELGMTMFRKFDGRMAPTYILLDRHGNVVMEWILTLPINRVLFEVKQSIQQA